MLEDLWKIARNLLSYEYYMSIMGESKIIISIYCLFCYKSNTLKNPDLKPTAIMQSLGFEQILVGKSFYIVNSFSTSIFSAFQSLIEQSLLIVATLLVNLLYASPLMSS